MLSVLALILGPLRLRWVSAWRDGRIDNTVLSHIAERNKRTTYYRIAMACLVIGLFAYLASLILFLLIA